MSFFKNLVMVSLGLYAGIYLDQNFVIPRVDEPQGIINKAKDLINQYKKDNGDDKKS